MKQFDTRNEDKKQVDERKSIHARAWQIRHCKLWINVWSEEDGKWWFLRPVLVIWHIGKMLIVAPTTTNSRHSTLPFYHEIQTVDFGSKDDMKVRSFVMLSQLRSIDSKRLIKHKYTITHDELVIIRKTLAGFIC